MLFGELVLLPKLLELAGIEIGQNFPIDVNDRRQGLATQREHLFARCGVADHVEQLVFYAAFVQPFLRLVTPTSVRFDEQSNLVRFHLEI